MLHCHFVRPLLHGVGNSNLALGRIALTITLGWSLVTSSLAQAPSPVRVVDKVRPFRRSAGFQPAVSPISNRQIVAVTVAPSLSGASAGWKHCDTAGWKPALRLCPRPSGRAVPTYFNPSIKNSIIRSRLMEPWPRSGPTWTSKLLPARCRALINCIMFEGCTLSSAVP